MTTHNLLLPEQLRQQQAKQLRLRRFFHVSRPVTVLSVALLAATAVIGSTINTMSYLDQVSAALPVAIRRPTDGRYASSQSLAVYRSEALVGQVLGASVTAPLLSSEASASAGATSTVASLVRNQLNQYLSQGLLTGPQGPEGPAGSPGNSGVVQNDNGQSTAVIGGNPIVTYVPPVPADDFAGASLSGFGQLSAQSFSVQTAAITGALNVSGAATLSGLNVTGPTTLSGSTTIASLNVSNFNPGLTLGSVGFQGASGITQDNSNFFYDATDHRLGLGTTTPAATLEINTGTPGNTGLRFSQVIADSAATSTIGKFLSVDSSGNVVLADASTPATGGQLVYDKSYFSNLNDFTVTGSTPTLVNGAIELNPVTTDSFDGQNLQLNSFTSTDEDVDFEVTAKVVALPAGSSYGIGIGRISLNSWYPVSLSVQFDMSATPNVMRIWPQASGASTTPVGSKNVSTPPVAVGDLITLVYSQRGATVTVSENDITQDTFNSYTLTNGVSVPNTSQFRIFGFGGTFDIEAVRLISRQTVAPRVVFIGDSKTMGTSLGDINLRFASLVPSLGPIDVFAGNGDRTVEAVQDVNYIASLKPQYAIINIGRNDLASGVATATWEANYETIVSTLKAAGVTVIHLLPIPELSTPNQSALTNFINATYPSDGKIDVSGSWNNSVDLSADNIHPNVNGHRLIANAILSSGLIPTSPNSLIVDTAPYLFSQTLSPLQAPWIASGSNMYNLNDNIGIGTVTPASLLFVQGTAGATSTLLTVASSSGSSYLAVTPAGSVGIGSSSPAATLAIQGSGSSNSFVVASSTGIQIVAVTPSNFEVDPQTGNTYGGLFVNNSNGYIGNNPNPVTPIDFSNTNLSYNAPQQILFADTVVQGTGLTDISSLAAVTVNTGSLTGGGPTYRCASCRWTAGSAGADGADSITLDFGSSYDIMGVTFGSWFRTGCTLGGVAIDGSNDDSTWTNLGNPTYTCHQIAMFAHGGYSGPTFGSYRYLRISYTVAGVSTQMAGLQVFSDQNGALWGNNVWGAARDGASTVWMGVANGSGGVGIGTGSPQDLLQLQAGSVYTSDLFDVASSSGASFFHVANGGNVGIGSSSPAALLGIKGTSGSATDLLNVASSSNTSEFIVKSTGNVGIGTSTPTYLLYVGSASVASGTVAQFQNTNGTCAINPTMNTLACSSDERLKKDIIPYGNDALDQVMALQPVFFNWNAEATGTPEHPGFIAQQVQQVMPEVVSTDPNTGLLSIGYSDLVPSVVAAMQQMQAEIATLQGGLSGNATATNLSVYSPANFSGDSVGEAEIPAGQTSVRVTFSQSYEYQPIVTLTPTADYSGHFWVGESDASGFTIEIDEADNSLLIFNWHSFASAVEQLTVSDGSTSPIQLFVPPVPQSAPSVVVPPVENGSTGATTSPGSSASTTPTNDSASSIPAVLGDTTTTPSATTDSDRSTEEPEPSPEPPAGDSGEAEHSFRKEAERHSGMIPNTIGA